MKEKQYSIKIPNSIKIFYCEKKNILIIEGPFKKNLIKLKTKLKLVNELKTIYIKSMNCKNTTYGKL